MSRLRHLRAILIMVVVLTPARNVSSADGLEERGAYLVEVVGACATCHTPYENGRPNGSKHLAGGMRIGGKGFVAYASNITPDPETGIGRWTTDQIVRALREGKRPDRTTIGVMPFDLYRRISDRDALAIATYLKARDPVRNRVPKSTFTAPLPDSYGPPVTGVRNVRRDDRVGYGAYLVGPVGRCIECHTPSSNERPDYKSRLGAGGVVFTGPWGVSVSGNITPDKNTGLGVFTDQQIRSMIVSGVRPNRSRLGPPMAHDFYGGLAGEDVDAIVAYLRSIAPIDNFIDK